MKTFKNNTIQADRFLIVKCRAFSGDGVKSHRVMVEADKVDGDNVTEGRVLVWDSVAGNFTTCHAITPRTIARIRRTSQA